MTSRLVIPTDFSRPAARAVEAALGLAEALGAEAELVHVCNAVRRLYHLTWTPAGFAEEQAAAERGAQARLDALAAAFAVRGVPVRTRVLGPTEPAVGVLRAADGADLVVLGTRGASGDRPGLGPVAATVAREARVPVLLVGPEGGRLTRGLRVLVPVDLSAASAAALRAARDVAARLGGVVEVVHAVPETAAAATWGGEAVEADDDETPAERRLRHLERFVDTAGGAPAPVLLRLVEGRPVEAVARVAWQDRPGLVVVPRPSARPSAADALLDAATEAARCPSLRVPVP